MSQLQQNMSMMTGGNKTAEIYANGAKKTYDYNSRNLVTKTQSYDKAGTKTLI